MNYSKLQARAIEAAHTEGGAIERAVLGLLVSAGEAEALERDLDAAAHDAGLASGPFVEAVYAAQGCGILKDVEWDHEARTVRAKLVT